MTTTVEFIKIKEALAHQREFDCVENELLGQGSYGWVIKANCRQDGKAYAIKLMSMSEEMTKQQEREIKALIKLNLSEKSKRNVIEYFKAWKLQVGDKKMLCIQMELCSGDLETFVYKNRNFAPSVTKGQSSPQFYQHVFQQILNGLIFIHSIGWVHRDIHPGNILVVKPNPQQISDIHVKIADFGLGRNIRDMGVALHWTDGWSIQPELDQCTPRRRQSLYNAPELFFTKYDYKVDIYSAGIVLYFISLYPEEKTEWITELSLFKQDKVDIQERLAYNNNQLPTLIKDMVQRNPDRRPDAHEAKKRMFPEARDSTDANETQKIKFYVRKENEQGLRMCYLNNLTFSALKAEVERRTMITQGQLRGEDMINGEKRHIIIDNDESVEHFFRDAKEKGRDVEIVVIQQEDDNTRTGNEQMSSGDISMTSA